MIENDLTSYFSIIKSYLMVHAWLHSYNQSVHGEADGNNLRFQATVKRKHSYMKEEEIKVLSVFSVVLMRFLLLWMVWNRGPAAMAASSLHCMRRRSPQRLEASGQVSWCPRVRDIL